MPTQGSWFPLTENYYMGQHGPAPKIQAKAAQARADPREIALKTE